MNPECDVFGTDNAVVAFGNLVFQHGRIRPDTVEIVALLVVHAVTVLWAERRVDKGKLKGQGTVKVAEKKPQYPSKMRCFGRRWTPRRN